MIMYSTHYVRTFLSFVLLYLVTKMLTLYKSDLTKRFAFLFFIAEKTSTDTVKTVFITPFETQADILSSH